MGKGGFFSGFSLCSELCVAIIALAVCALVKCLSVWGGKILIDVSVTD